MLYWWLLVALAVHGSQAYTWREQWYRDMPIDHFSFVDGRTFSLRFLVNDDNFTPSSPILFYCGNEGDIELFANNTGFMWDLAPSLNAMVIFAEHRYYGKTMPFGDESYKSLHNLGYLTSTQALADYALLITHIKSAVIRTRDSPVIAFGGSYGGMLAAWMRMKYPHIIDGALAASAPVIQFTGYTPCWTYNSIVTRTFANSGPQCADTIKNSWPALRRLATTADGRQQVNDAMHLCDDSLLRNEQNVTTLVNWLIGAWGELPMIDYPTPTRFLSPVPAWPVKEACKYLTTPNATDIELVKAIHSAVSVYQNYTGQKQCFDIRADTSPDLGTSGWDFQACTAMVMPMCSNGTDMFEVMEWNPETYATDCANKYWGVKQQPSWAMVNYGSYKLTSCSNIIFSNGYLDPWSGGGITSLPFSHPSVYLIEIKEGAHHYDLRGADPQDTQEIKDVRHLETKIITKWINKHYKDHQVPIKYKFKKPKMPLSQDESVEQTLDDVLEEQEAQMIKINVQPKPPKPGREPKPAHPKPVDNPLFDDDFDFAWLF